MEGSIKKDNLIAGHQLRWEFLKGAGCVKGHEGLQLHTTKAACCTCGWVCWSPRHEEAKQAHVDHLVWLANYQEQVQREWQAKSDSLHELEWRGPKAGACRGCSWSVYGLDSSRIVEAFSEHKRSALAERLGYT